MEYLFLYKLLIILLSFALLSLLVIENLDDIKAIRRKMVNRYPYKEANIKVRNAVYKKTQCLLSHNIGHMGGISGRHYSKMRQFINAKHRNRYTLNSFGTAVLAEAVFQEYRCNGSLQAKSVLDLHLNKIIENGEFKKKIAYVDHCMIGYTILNYYLKNNNINHVNVAHDIRNFLFSQVNQTSGTIPYRKEKPDLLFVDTLGMICPFLSKYGNVFQDEEALKLAYNNLRYFYTNAVCEQTGLPYHVYDEKQGCSLVRGWARGAGWYAVAIADSIPCYLKNTIEYQNLSEQLIKFVEAACVYQKDNGCWSWNMQFRYSPDDLSGTAMIGLAIMKGIHLGILPETYLWNVERIVEAIVVHTTSQGEITGSLGECAGIGVYPQIYGVNQWGQGYGQLMLIHAGECNEK